jgi:hypothetical protein
VFEGIGEVNRVGPGVRAQRHPPVLSAGSVAQQSEE